MKPKYAKNECITISLITGKKGRERVPAISGLNWGQRHGREPNQAYLAIPVEIQNSNFLPPAGQEFTIRTADGQSWKCARRQANGKAIHTIENNSIFGRYFREKLGLNSGSLVTITHLLKYGRTSVELYKISNNEYFLDFEPTL